MTRPPSAWTMETVMSTIQAAAARLEAEGETDREQLLAILREDHPDLDAVFVRLVRARREAIDKVAVLSARIAELETRKKREARVNDKCRATLFAAMDSLGMAKWGHAEATVIIEDGRMHAVVTDPLQLPSEYATVTVKPNMAKIERALAAGEEVPGVEVRNAAPVLKIYDK